MISGFQQGAYQFSAYQVEVEATAPVTTTAFQPQAFQADAFQTASSTAPSTRAGFEFTSKGGFRQLLARTLEQRYPKPQPKSRRTAKQAQAIVLDAAKVVLAGEPEQQTQAHLRALLERWKPVVRLPDADPFDVFLAQIARAVRQMEEDEEEEIAVALMLMH